MKKTLLVLLVIFSIMYLFTVLEKKSQACASVNALEIQKIGTRESIQEIVNKRSAFSLLEAGFLNDEDRDETHKWQLIRFSFFFMCGVFALLGIVCYGVGKDDKNAREMIAGVFCLILAVACFLYGHYINGSLL